MIFRNPFKSVLETDSHSDAQIADMKAALSQLQARAKAMEGRPVYVQVKPYSDNDPAFQEWAANLQNDPRFQWLITKFNNKMIDIHNAIPTNDPASEAMRMRANYRMDGVKMLIDDLVELRRAFLLSSMPEPKEGLAL